LPGYITDGLSFDDVIDIAPPIGVRCISVSTVGTAKLDPVASVFFDFIQEAEAPSSTSTESAASLLGLGSRQLMKDKYYQLFNAANSRAMSTMSNSFVYNSYLSAQELQQTVRNAYNWEILNLMYDGMYGHAGSWEHDGLTSSSEGKIMTMGVIPPAVPGVFFIIWAVGSIVLALTYGFRRRHAESLDGFDFFRLGVYNAQELANSPELRTAGDAYEVDRLWSLSGRVDSIT
jgi:hypothetical protein